MTSTTVATATKTATAATLQIREETSCIARYAAALAHSCRSLGACGSTDEPARVAATAEIAPGSGSASSASRRRSGDTSTNSGEMTSGTVEISTPSRAAFSRRGHDWTKVQVRRLRPRATEGPGRESRSILPARLACAVVGCRILGRWRPCPAG